MQGDVVAFIAMYENRDNQTAHGGDALLDQELHLIRCYRLTMPCFAGSPFETLASTMLGDLEKGVKTLRNHINNGPIGFFDRSANPLKSDCPAANDLSEAAEYLRDGERMAIHQCEKIVSGGRIFNALNSIVRSSILPMHENHSVVLGIIISASGARIDN